MTPLGAVLSELVVRCFAEGTRIAVPGGERMRLDWASGNGKTTLLRLVAGLYVPERGVVSVHGEKPSETLRRAQL